MPEPEVDFVSFVDARWSRIVSSGDPEPYVRRVLFTTYSAWWRRRWTGEHPVANVPDSRVVDDGAGLVALRHELLAAIATLPRGQRAVVVCRHVDDLTERQTAELLGCSVGTVKSQHTRAIRRLQALLSDSELADPEGVR